MRWKNFGFRDKLLAAGYQRREYVAAAVQSVLLVGTAAWLL